MLTRSQKEALLTEYSRVLADTKGVVFIDYKGTPVKELNRLRSDARVAGMSFRVTKNTVLRLALAEHGIELPEDLQSRQLALAESPSDEVAPVKLAVARQKEVEQLEVVGAIVGGKLLNLTEAKQLASLPGKDDLRAQLVGLLASPLIGLVRTLQAPLTGLVTVLHQYAEQRR